MSDSVQKKVITIFAKHAKMDSETLSLDMKLEDTEIDSLGMIEVMFDLEDEFDIEIPEPQTIEERASQFRTLGDVVTQVELIVNQEHAA